MLGCRIKVVRPNALTGENCNDTPYENEMCEFHFHLTNGYPLRTKRRGRNYSMAFARLAIAAEKQQERKRVGS